MAPMSWWNERWFRWIHGNNLVYNACWEDPRIDREALSIGPNDSIVMITSAGCNALDYALLGPRRIHAVDVNPRQNALLELKMAGIRNLDYETFFDVFGRGRLDRFSGLYHSQLRRYLSFPARAYWDRHARFFGGSGARGSFYFHGTSGYLAWLVNMYLNRSGRLRDGVTAMLGATNLSEQREIYFGWLREAFWNRFLRWSVKQDMALALLGVPEAQRRQVDRYYAGGISRFIEESIDAVFGRLPLLDNYFWRVYLTGEYTADCCPEYLKRGNFQRLKAGLINAIEIHTNTLEGFLRHTRGPFTRFVLLDHMDWLSAQSEPWLQHEWQTIVRRAAPGARLIWRSGGLKVDYVDPLTVSFDGRDRRLGDLLHYREEEAARLHALDRVHTYGSFYIADFVPA